MKFNQIRNLVLVLTLSVMTFACGDSSTSTSADAEQATVNGRVENNEGANKAIGSDQQMATVEGATVTAARVTADGSLETIENAEAETNADGEFTLKINTDAAANAAGKIIVKAEKEGQQWKGCIHGKLEGESSIDLKPLTVESSGEASVYQKVVANGNTDMVSKADIEAFIGTKAAAEIKDNSDAAAEFASALAAEAQARAKFFAAHSMEVTDQQMTEIMNTKADAFAKLNASLYASTSESAKADAYQTFFETVANAYVKAEVDANAYAKAEESASHMLIKNTTELSTEARSEVRAKLCYMVAIAIDNAVQARMKAASAAETSVQAAAEAGTKLRADLMAKTTATKSEVDAMFETYNEAIVDVMQTEFSANSQVIVDINGQINDTGGVKADLESTLEGSISTDVLVQAYTTFSTNVKSIVDENFSSATDTQAKLVTDIMILINISN